MYSGFSFWWKMNTFNFGCKKPVHIQWNNVVSFRWMNCFDFDLHIKALSKWNLKSKMNLKHYYFKCQGWWTSDSVSVSLRAAAEAQTVKKYKSGLICNLCVGNYLLCEVSWVVQVTHSNILFPFSLRGSSSSRKG